MTPLNATLLIQIGNFVVAWKILDRFLLQECVQEIRAEDHVISALQESVAAQQVVLRKIEEEQVRVLADIREQFAIALPPIPSDLALKVVPLDQFIVNRECDVVLSKETADGIVAALVKRITDV